MDELSEFLFSLLLRSLFLQFSYFLQSCFPIFHFLLFSLLVGSLITNFLLCFSTFLFKHLLHRHAFILVIQILFLESLSHHIHLVKVHLILEYFLLFLLQEIWNHLKLPLSTLNSRQRISSGLAFHSHLILFLFCLLGHFLLSFRFFLQSF